MDFNDYKTLTIGGMAVKKIVTSTGKVIFNAIPSPLIPSTASLSQKSYYSMLPTQLEVRQYDYSTMNGWRSSYIYASKYQETQQYVKYEGSTYSNYAKYTISLDSDKTPTNISNHMQLGAQNLPLSPAEGFSISKSDIGTTKTYDFTNPYSEEPYIQHQYVKVVWGQPTTTSKQLALSGNAFVDSDNNTVLTIGSDGVGYTSTMFGSSSSYNFNSHKGEQFTLTSSNELSTISFTIGGI